MLLGKKLKSLRTAKGFSPDIVAERIGVSKSTYGRYERDETTPDLKSLEMLAQLYEIEIYELLTDDKIFFTQNNKKSTGNGFYVYNNLSDKLIEQLELRIKEKDELIALLKSELSKKLL